MRGSRWLLIGKLGLGSCLLAGCLRALPPQSRRSPADVSTQALANPSEEKRASPPSSDYLVSQTLPLPPSVQQTAATGKTLVKQEEQPAAKPVEPVEMRIQLEESSPAHPPEPPPHMEIHPAPLTRPDAPCVQVLRGLLDRHSEEEINEQLKSYDPATRDVMLLLLTSVVQLEQDGGLPRIPPRELAAWTERLNTLTASLRSRAQLILERACFCSCINNFGNYTRLPSEHTFFHPGELAHVYVQAGNLSSRRRGEKYVTVLKARMEIYDENNRKTPQITWTSEPREDVSASPRQDYYINFRFQVPPSCPSGLYTLRITVEDWTDAAPGATKAPEWRIAHCTLDFRVGGPIARPARNRIASAVGQP
jgi:hypothetical protein